MSAPGRKSRRDMFRDEGTAPSVEFNRRMKERVERTPTQLLVTVVPFLAVARAALIAKGFYTRARCATLSQQIDTDHDLRSIVA